MKCALCREKICLENQVCKELSKINSKKENLDHYLNDSSDKEILEVSSKISKDMSRLEEIASYAELMGLKRIGIAFCKGLQSEGKLIHKYFKSKEIEAHSVICNYVSLDKSDLGLPENGIEKTETICDPYGQASVLNKVETDLNIAVGFCIGHDLLFSKHSNAPVTTLVVKDRINGHCFR